MPSSDAAECAQRIKTVRNAHTPTHIERVCRIVTLLNRAKITEDGFGKHGRLHELHWC